MSPKPQRPPRTTIQRAPICPERVRTIGTDSFAFVPHRFLRQGFFASLTMDERGLYFFLVLAADRYGVSFYHYETICSLLQIPLDDCPHIQVANPPSIRLLYIRIATPMKMREKITRNKTA